MSRRNNLNVFFLPYVNICVFVIMKMWTLERCMSPHRSCRSPHTSGMFEQLVSLNGERCSLLRKHLCRMYDDHTSTAEPSAAHPCSCSWTGASAAAVSLCANLFVWAVYPAELFLSQPSVSGLLLDLRIFLRDGIITGEGVAWHGSEITLYCINITSLFL